jgi:type II secretion system protein I
MRAAKPKTEGFTLLEILVATAILGTAVAALFSLLSGSLSNIDRLRGPSEAMMLAQSRMNELLATGTLVGQGTDAAIPLDHKVEGRWNDVYRWEAIATRFEQDKGKATGRPILVRIGVDVFWKSSPNRPEKKYSLESYQLRYELPAQ